MTRTWVEVKAEVAAMPDVPESRATPGPQPERSADPLLRAHQALTAHVRRFLTTFGVIVAGLWREVRAVARSQGLARR